MPTICAITSQGACGIADYGLAVASALLHGYDPFRTSPEEVLNYWWMTGLDQPQWLDPQVFFRDLFDAQVARGKLPDLIWLNYHAGLHSRWTEEHVVKLQGDGFPVVVTYHDTFSGAADQPNSDRCKALCEVADGFVVHEPVTDLDGAYLIRHGIPRLVKDKKIAWLDPTLARSYPQQPLLGSVGFNFPWKNFDRLAELTGQVGWALLLCCNDASDEDEARWHAKNPNLRVIRGFLPQDEAVWYLAQCTATAFMYECANTGTSGAIRQGIAARRPVIAMRSCRQFRDLYAREFLEGRPKAIRWVEDWEALKNQLLYGWYPSTTPGALAQLAEEDSWTNQGEIYAQVFEAAVTRRQEAAIP